VKERFGEDLALSEIRAELDATAPKLPAEVAMGVTDGGIADLGRLVHGVLLGMLAGEAIKVEDQASLAGAHRELTALIKSGGLDGLVLYARLHSEDMAKGVMGMVVAQAKMQGADAQGLTFDVSDDAVGVVIDVGGALPESVLAQMFVELGVVPNLEHPATSALVGALRSIKQAVWFDRIGAGLRLSFGPRAKRARPLRAKKLGPSYRAASEDIMWLRWRIKPWADALGAVDASLANYEGTPAWRAYLKAYPDTSGMGLSTAIEAMKQGEAGQGGDSRLWASDGVLHSAGHVDGIKQKPSPLKGSALMQLVPAAATMATVDSIYAMDVALGSMIDAVSANLAALTDDTERIRTLTAALKEQLKKGAEGVFERGGAFLVGWGGDVDNFEVVRTRENGTQKRLVGKHLPNYGVAIAVPLATGVDGLAFGAETLGKVGEALCVTAGGTLAPDTQLTRSVKLGLGVPTLAIPWST
ncbi:MAG: hypothetical protein QF464_18320, partial [Myxococcota bacterium]|nr:hypothetical protein [Myxococcota bacterium]